MNLESPALEFSASDDAGLGVYEDVWNACATGVNKALPASFTVKQFISDVWTKTKSTQERTAVFGLNLDEDRRWADSEIESSNRRITDLELSMGSARENWTYGPTRCIRRRMECLRYRH